MPFYHHYLQAAQTIVEKYNGDRPLAVFLKSFFSANRKYGSKDRKKIAALCYGYYRVSKALTGGDVQQKLLHAFFLTHQTKNDLLQQLAPHLNELAERPLPEKLTHLQAGAQDVFPIKHLLSPEFNNSKFFASFFTQPLLFLRSRPGRHAQVMQKLQQKNIEIISSGEGFIGIDNATKLDDVLLINKEAVVQDLSSQQVFNFLKTKQFNKTPDAWDTCAASGGKSILLHDILNGKLKLTVSDVRTTILHNLTERCRQAGVNLYRKFAADLKKAITEVADERFDIIVADVPCTGSGTWARTPEQLYFFDEKCLQDFTERQKQIASNTLSFLKPGGLFFYITCSVFASENEAVLQWLLQKPGLRLLHQQYITGYHQKADSMFVAVLQFN